MIITEMCAFEVKEGHGFVLTEIAEGVTVEQVKTATQAPFTVSSQLKSMRGSARAAGHRAVYLKKKIKYEENQKRHQRHNLTVSSSSPLPVARSGAVG